MYQSQEQLVAASRAQLETAMCLASAALRGFEQVITLQLDAAKDALAEGTTSVRAFAAVKDPKEMTELQQRFVAPNVEKAQSYAREMYGVATQFRQEVDAVLSRQVAEFNKSMVAALEQAAKAAPNGTDYAVSALRSAVLGANAAAESISKLGKQVAAAADANVAALVRSNGGKKKAA
jgi:phasin family protein